MLVKQKLETIMTPSSKRTIKNLFTTLKNPQTMSLLNKRREYFFFLQEELTRKLSPIIITLCSLASCLKCNVLNRSKEYYILNLLKAERYHDLIVYHLKALQSTAGSYKNSDDEGQYAPLKRDPVPASEYRKKDGKRITNTTRLIPFIDPWFYQKKESEVYGGDYYKLHSSDPMRWRDEAKEHCPKYNNFVQPYGDYSRVAKAVRNGQLIIHKQSNLINLLRNHFDENHWWYFTNEMFKRRAQITCNSLKRMRRKLSKTHRQQ